MRRYGPFLVFALICAALALILGANQPTPNAENWPIGQRVPQAVLPLWKPGSGAPNAATPSLPMSLPSVGGGYVINLFASWCAPCQAELPVLEELRTKHGIPILGVAWKDKPAALEALLAKHTNPYQQILLDPEGKAMLALGATGVPETFLVDAKGIIIKRYRSNLQPEDAAAIAALLHAR